MKKITCCMSCKEPIRHIGCHETCATYINQKKEMEEEQAEIRKAKEKNKLIREYVRSRQKNGVKTL